MTPLPATHVPSALAFWVAMQPQPTGNDFKRYIWGCSDGVHSYKNPYAVGDILYEREEWRVWLPFGGMVQITYRDGQVIDYPILTYGDIPAFIEMHNSQDWQPASTMPELASRKRYTVASVEAKLIDVVGAPFREGDDPPEGEEWRWYITLTELKGEHNEN